MGPKGTTASETKTKTDGQDNATAQAATSNGNTTPTPTPTATEPQPGENPPWLPERLAQAKRTALAEKLQDYGVKDEVELKARLDELETLKKSSMTEAEQRAAELEELKPKAAKVSQYETIIKARVTAELADLTDEQRASVQALAGDDPAKMLQTIDVLKPTWEKQAKSAEAEKPAAAQTPAANTAPARGAAPTESNESPPDHKRVWEELERTNPFRAAAYFRQHKAEIFPSGS